ncbi:MAG: rhamnulokinase [Pirellulales bacterium]|nr:rhamnulokinase [Pirellulales bacterium]
MAERIYLAVDLGASSGRLLAGSFDGARLRLEELHRFENGPVSVACSKHWDLLALWQQIQIGMRGATQRYGREIASLAVDTWGVDFGLLGAGDVLLGNPYHYRDSRTDGILAEAFQRVPQAEIFATTGIQFMPFNTLYQLWAMRLANSPLLTAARRLLLMPDLFHWLLTGVAANERTNASTTQFYNPRTRNWAGDLLAKFDLSDELLGELIEPGTRLGPLRPEVAHETGLSGITVVAPASHDTASAVMAVPAATFAAADPDWCYISSGTWSLMGMELPRPVIDDTSLALNFTNEVGVGNTIRLLKNIAGLWLVQESRRSFAAAGRQYSWEELARLAVASPHLVSLIDPDDASFLAPADMPGAIRDFCLRTGQPLPDSDGAVIRCALDSLALRYRWVLECLERLSGRAIGTIHIVGGGVQNTALCQATADCCGRRVLAGPVEATALGNVLMQTVASGDVADWAQARALVRASFDVTEYLPRRTHDWQSAYERFQQLVTARA